LSRSHPISEDDATTVPRFRALGLACALLGFACASSGPPEKIESGSAVSFELFQPDTPPVQDTDAIPLQAVAENDQQWDRTWVELFGTDSDVPAIDFASWRVAVVALATQPTGGIVVAVDRVVETPTLIQVQAVETVPGPGCMTIQALTRPVSFTLLPRSPKPVEFHLERHEETCAVG